MRKTKIPDKRKQRSVCLTDKEYDFIKAFDPTNKGRFFLGLESILMKVGFEKNKNKKLDK